MAKYSAFLISFFAFWARAGADVVATNELAGSQNYVDIFAENMIDSLADQLADRVVDWTSKPTFVDSADLDTTSLGLPGLFEASHRYNMQEDSMLRMLLRLHGGGIRGAVKKTVSSDAKPKTEKKTKAKKEKAVKKEKKEKKEKDPNAPKKPVGGGYGIFAGENRAAVAKTLPAGFKQADVMKKLGEQWKALPDSDKKAYVEKAEKKMEEYKKAMETYQKK